MNSLFKILDNTGMKLRNVVKKYNIFLNNGQKGFFKFSFGVAWVNRTAIINHFIKKYSYRSYLEIGVRNPRENFDKIRCKNKNGVDPFPMGEYDYKMTSDKFFNWIPVEKKYDIIFIDGEHTENQSMRDIFHSLQHLSENGTILMHDCNPPTELHQRKKSELSGKNIYWNGTVWKTFVKLRWRRDDLKMYVVDTDWGIGIIQKGYQDIFLNSGDEEIIKYGYLKKHRKEVLNLITVKEFLKIF